MPEKTEKHLRVNESDPEKWELSWFKITYLIVLHVSAVYGLYLLLFHAKICTVLWVLLVHFTSAIGMAAGAHRLWAHRSYKAKLPLRILLAFLQTVAFQGTIISWCLTHRVHHKYSDTDGDPHNANRGFFYSHVGWLMYRTPPKVRRNKSKMDISDLTSDPLLVFQQKYYRILMPLLCFIIPTAVPVYFWGETWRISWHTNSFRYIFGLNITFLVNSLAHLYGNRPYDKTINPRENALVAFLIMGEGWHNYHHAFPYDYRTAELGKYLTNGAAGFLDLMAKIGWAYDLKSVTAEMVKHRVKRTGDGSHPLWGWGDKDQPEEEKKMVEIEHPEADVCS